MMTESAMKRLVGGSEKDSELTMTVGSFRRRSLPHSGSVTFRVSFVWARIPAVSHGIL